ncbi:MAG: hypothetical protein FWC15_05045 [Fibromonadales bacterium]|nr:hypothetical protein [Fibromonadales bacterium]
MQLKYDLTKLRLNGKRVVCLGLEKALEYTLSSHPFLRDFIDFIIDSDGEQVGKALKIFDRSYQVYPIEKLMSLNDSYALLITTISETYSTELCEALMRVKELENIDCYVMHTCYETPVPYETPKILSGSEMKIPKKIHWCWFSGEELSDENKRWIESWSKFCPDYEILLWNAENYDVAKNRYMYDAYKERKWAFASDFARLDIVYNNGGIYLDADVEVIKNFDDLLYDDAFFCFDRDLFIDSGSGFGSVKNNKLILEALELYNDISFYNKDGSLNLLTSPKIITPIFIKYELVQENILQMINGARVYPTDVLSPEDWKTRELNITNNTHSIHRYQSGWLLKSD